MKSAHRVWRLRVQKLLAGTEEFEEKDVASHRDCKLGKWYYGDGQSKFRGDSTFAELGAAHEKMHNEVKETARLWKEGKRHEAEQSAQDVYRLSEEVVRLLDELTSVSV
jgi:methyl-accepting chemotaxis protein